MNIPWTDIGTVSTAALSAVATVGAWLAARRSAKTADTVARIERERWHAELTPQFEITIERGDGNRATLDVQLRGPISLRHLDEISIRIINSDDMSYSNPLPGGPSQEELDAQIWGPYRFTHGADGADVNGQTVTPFPLHVGRGRPFSIELTRPPHWQEGADRAVDWWSRWVNKPMRLVITCKSDNFDPWIVPYEVEVPGTTRIRHL